MRKISYYLFFIILTGVAISSYWGYDRYFKVEDKEPVMFVVSRGDLQEIVRIRGKVVSQKDFDLEFPFSGIVEQIFVKEGSTVGFGVPIIKLDTINLELEIKQLEAQLTQDKANFDKLKKGSTIEDINISKIKVKNAEIAVADAHKNLINNLKDAYIRSDNAVRNNSDQLFSNPRSANPDIIFQISNAQLRSDIETRRLMVENILSSWKLAVDKFTDINVLDEFTNIANKNMEDVVEFLDRLALAVNGLTKNSLITQVVVDGYKDDVSSARSDLSVAIVGVTSAEENRRNKESNLALALLELELKISGTRKEDLTIAEAKITETESKISIKKERIRKSTLYSPGRIKIEKIWLEKSEIARSGSVVVSLASLGFKIQADVSEIEISKFDESNGNDVLIELDAIRSRLLTGKVVSIEPRKVVKDGDTYYKVNIHFDAPGKKVRTGMSADLTVNISKSIEVLNLPEIAVSEKDKKYFVTINRNNIVIEQEVEVGISDGENIEIKSGLSLGDVVVMPTN